MPLPKAKKIKNPSIDYLDLFCGNGKRLRQKAKTRHWKKKNLFGIEIQKPRAVQNTKKNPVLVVGKNLRIKYADALRWPFKRKEKSVKEINVDYLLGGVKSPLESKGGLDYEYDRESHNRDRRIRVIDILSQSKRVLVKGGFLSVSDYKSNISFLLQSAEKLGFKLEGVYWITSEKQAKSRDLMHNLREVQDIQLARKNVNRYRLSRPEEPTSFESTLNLLDSQEKTRQPVRLVFSKK